MAKVFSLKIVLVAMDTGRLLQVVWTQKRKEGIKRLTIATVNLAVFVPSHNDGWFPSYREIGPQFPVFGLAVLPDHLTMSVARSHRSHNFLPNAVPRQVP